MIRFLVCAAVLLAPFAFGQKRPIAPVDCDDTYAECKEDCAIRFGGTTSMSMRAKLNPCLNKCNGVERDCRETFFETRRNNLDEGSISGAPTSRDVDSEGLPTKTAQKKPEPKKVDRHDEELRESTAPAPAPEKAKEPEPVREEATPKSSRSQVKTEADKSAPPAAAAKKEEPAPRAEEPPPPPPKKEEKKREEPPKKEEKKKRALDEWDPEAM